MARVQIQFPPSIIYKTTIDVRITDLNYGDHVGNDSMLSIIHEARVRFLTSLHYSEKDIEGIGIIMSDAVIQYLGEAFYNDELLIEIAINDITRVGFDMFYNITCNGKNIALAKTGIIFYNYSLKKVVSIPELFLKKLTNLLK